MLKRFLATVLLAVGLAACGGVPQSPQQSVFEVKSTYGLALNAAANYAELPYCSAVQKQPCSDPAAVAQLKKAQPAASATLDAAENAVRTPGFGDNVVKSAVVAAQQAMKAFAVVVNQYTKPAEPVPVK